MLDPLYQVNLNHIRKKPSNYYYNFKAPDRLGVYKFEIEYRRYGYTFIDEILEVSVIQYRHDEFPRFLTIAYPYYVTVFASMTAGFIFIVFFLFSDFTKAKIGK